MAKALQRRRGTHEEHQNFTGLVGEFTYDTTEKRIVAHDGVTKGGIPMATKKEVEEVANSLDPRILDAASQSDILEAVSQATVGNVDAPTLEGLQAQIASNASNIETKLPNTTVHIVETWSNGTNWYRKYSDGWIEQGGISPWTQTPLTITLHVAMIDTNYSVFVSYNGDGSLTNGAIECFNKTTTTFTMERYSKDAVAWKVVGKVSS